MPVIAFMNQKGGVGKTTTAVNVGAALARAGRRVCMIDVDPQAHLTMSFGLDPSADVAGLYDVLVNDRPLGEATHAVNDRLSVVPADTDLAGAEIELVTVIGRELVLRHALEAATEKYDYVLLDCPPSLGLLTLNGLAAADSVVIPMQPHFLALQGMAKLLETVRLVQQRMNPKLRVGGIALTMFDPQAKLSQEVINEVENFIAQAVDKNLPWSNARVFKTRIRRNIKLAESPSFGQPIFDYDPSSNGAADYRALADELIAAYETKPAAPATPTPVAASTPSASVSPASSATSDQSVPEKSVAVA